MTHRYLVKPCLMVGTTTLLFLLVPLGAMQFTREVSWGPGDFAAAGFLLFAAGTALVIAVQRLSGFMHRLAVALLILAVLASLWAELAVGVFR